MKKFKINNKIDKKLAKFKEIKFTIENWKKFIGPSLTIWLFKKLILKKKYLRANIDCLIFLKFNFFFIKSILIIHKQPVY